MFPENIQVETASLRHRFSLVPNQKQHEDFKAVCELSDDSDDTLVEDSELNRTFVEEAALLDISPVEKNDLARLESSLGRSKNSQAKG